MNDRDAALREVAALVSAALRNAHPSLEAQICPVAERLGLGPDATPEAAEMVLREALGLKACECAIGGPGTVIPIACPVHGTPCDMCGRVESCTDDCGDDAAGSGYRTVDLIPDRYGRLVKVASTGAEVVVIPPPKPGALFFGAKERDRFAKAWAEAERRVEAAARAVTTARAHPDGYGDTATCKHCRKPVARCAALPGHAGCTSGYGWIHSDPEQWGHSCRPRSGAPYALPSPSTEAAQAAGTED